MIRHAAAALGGRRRRRSLSSSVEQLTDASIRYSLVHSGRVGKRTRNQEVQDRKLDGGQKEDDGYGARKSDLEVGGFPATKRMMSSKSLESNRQEDRGFTDGSLVGTPKAA